MNGSNGHNTNGAGASNEDAMLAAVESDPREPISANGATARLEAMRSDRQRLLGLARPAAPAGLLASAIDEALGTSGEELAKLEREAQGEIPRSRVRPWRSTVLTRARATLRAHPRGLSVGAAAAVLLVVSGVAVWGASRIGGGGPAAEIASGGPGTPVGPGDVTRIAAGGSDEPVVPGDLGPVEGVVDSPVTVDGLPVLTLAQAEAAMRRGALAVRVSGSATLSTALDSAAVGRTADDSWWIEGEPASGMQIASAWSGMSGWDAIPSGPEPILIAGEDGTAATSTRSAPEAGPSVAAVRLARIDASRTALASLVAAFEKAGGEVTLVEVEPGALPVPLTSADVAEAMWLGDPPSTWRVRRSVPVIVETVAD